VQGGFELVAEGDNNPDGLKMQPAIHLQSIICIIIGRKFFSIFFDVSFLPFVYLFTYS
jgi:hypothetical protein